MRVRLGELCLLLSFVILSPGCHDNGGGPVPEAGVDAERDTDTFDDAGDAGDAGGDGGGDAEARVVVDADVGLRERPVNRTCVGSVRPALSPFSASLVPAFPSLPPFTQPVRALQRPGDGALWYVVERSGTILSFANDPLVDEVSTVVDLRSLVDSGSGEAGLLGMAFHPEFSSNGLVVLSYTTDIEGQLTSRLSTMLSLDGGTTLDPATEETLLEVLQPYRNHNGGHVAFGPAGLLFYALGDGGSGGDPDGNGQDTDTLLGSILRIDVDGPTPYGIPPDNPFADGLGGRREIYAWGFRNPWRFSIDRGTGELWAGDVGQRTFEEVDLVELGGNYGWNVMEGPSCYGGEPCESGGLLAPVAEYGRDDGQSITGGFVYRGEAIPALVGSYVYADFGSGRLWALRGDPVTGELSPEPLVDSGLAVSSFAEDDAGELYVLGYRSGSILRLEGSSEPVPSSVPNRLSETGCVVSADPSTPAPGLVPFDVIAPLWSDDADKDRWFALPEGATIDIAADGDFLFPPGTVLLKAFRFGGRLVETRLLVRHSDGLWAGYTYAWDEAQTDAFLVVGSERAVVDGRPWTFPSRPQCAQCHTAAADQVLGAETAQLNRSIVYPGGLRANQLATLEHVGLLSEPLPAAPGDLPALDGYADSAPVGARARAYLHANCSFCHRPHGPGRGDMDLRWQTSFAESGLCDTAPAEGDLGVSGARLLAPGEPESSLVLLRMGALDASRMPPLATELVDPVGTALVEDWALSLAGCP